MATGRKAILAALLAVFLPASSLAQVEYVPTPVSISAEIVKKGKSSFFAHVVRERQTLYSIARAYGVSPSEIIEANPKLHLEERALQTDAVLYIPIRTATPKVEEKVKMPPAEKPREPVATVPSSAAAPAIRVALLLPLGYETFDRNMTEFYSGALMAAKDLSKTNIEVRMNVINVSDPADRAIMNDVALQADVVIGPFSPADVAEVASSLPEGKFVVSPLDPRTAGLCDTLPVILANTPILEQVRDAAKWAREGSQRDTIIVVSETAGRLTPTLAAMREQFDTTSERNVIATNYVFVEGFDMANWFASHTHFADTLTKFYICSDKDIFIKDIIRNANVQIGFGKKVEVYGPAKARSGDMNDLSEGHVHASTTFHIDYSDTVTQAFVKDYRALYNSDPGQYAFHGYDTMTYFVKACAKLGPGWGSTLPFFEGRGLQTNFHFNWSLGRKGYVNDAVRRVFYTPDYKAKIMD